MKLKRNKDRRNSLTKAHHFVSRDLSDWEVMEGYTFNGDYVGYSTLSKPATGVGVLQQPIKEQYLKARKQGNSKKVQLRLVQTGLAVTLVDTGGGQRGDMFYDIDSISFIESLKFTVLSGNDKKVKAMFVPLSEQSMRSVKDKNAFTVEKSFHFLTQINHPPLLACVLRRPKGIKALDCHIFMLENVDDAFTIVNIIRQVQARRLNPELMTEVKSNDSGSFKRGQNSDVIRTEYGEYSVYRGQQQVELKDDYFRPPGQDGGREGDFRSPDNEEYNSGWSYRREQNPDDDCWRSYDNNGPFDRQDPRYAAHMRSNPQRDHDQAGREYVSHGQQMSSDSAERMNMSFGESYEGADRRSYNGGNISPRLAHAPPKVAEKPHKPDPLLRPMGPPSPGQHSPTGPLSPRSPNYQHPHPGSGYGQHSPVGRGFPAPTSPGGPVYSMSNIESRRDEPPRKEEESHPKPVAKVPPHMVAGVKVLPTGFAPSAIKLKPKAVKQEKSVVSEDSDPEYDNNFHVLKYKKQNDYGYESEKYISERSAYNGNAQSDNYRRGVDSHGDRGDNYGRGGDNYGKGEQYGRGDDYGKGEQYGRGDNNVREGDNYGRVGDNYSKGGENYDGYVEKVEHFDNNFSKENIQNRGFSYAPEYNPQHKEENRQFIESYDDSYGVQRRGSDKRPAGSNRYSVPSTIYDERSREPGNRWSGSSGGGGGGGQGQGQVQGRSQSSYDVSGRRPPTSGDDQRGKEAEIASMFTSIQIRKGEQAFVTSGNDFEESLGYLP